MRASALLCVGLLAGTAGFAHAQTAPVCVVLQDDAGDEAGAGPAAVPPDPSLDIQRVTLASDGRKLTAVMTVAAGRDPSSRVWSVSFGDGEQGYTLAAFEHVDGDRFGAYGPGGSTNQPPAGDAAGSIDLAAGRIRIEVPLAQLHIGRQASFYEFSASSGRSIGSNTGTGAQSTSTPYLGGDSAEGEKHYRLDRGCRS